MVRVRDRVWVQGGGVYLHFEGKCVNSSRDPVQRLWSRYLVHSGQSSFACLHFAQLVIATRDDTVMEAWHPCGIQSTSALSDNLLPHVQISTIRTLSSLNQLLLSSTVADSGDMYYCHPHGCKMILNTSEKVE
jgi:hypothetical protein